MFWLSIALMFLGSIGLAAYMLIRGYTCFACGLLVLAVVLLTARSGDDKDDKEPAPHA